MEKIDLLKKYRIGVLAGGPSSEREISLKSGKAVVEGLESLGLKPVFLDVSEDNFSSLLMDSGVDLAFIALHGRFGEDGTVQRMLEEEGIPYTGSGPDSSSLALDKVLSKKKFIENGLKVPGYVMVSSAEEVNEKEAPFPSAVKPRREGSSMGLSIVHKREDLVRAVEHALEFDREALIEEYVPGREITVGVLEGGALPVVEIKSSSGIYDFESKYTSSETQYIVPAELSPEEHRIAQEAGLRAHNSLGCKGFSRVDMRLTDSGEIFILEVNTIPGLTERSLLPMAAREEGISFPDLCIQMLCNAVAGRETQLRR